MTVTRFGSAAVETLLVKLARDPDEGVLNTDVQNRIHKSPVPDSYPYPFLTFFKRGARDIGPIGSNLPTDASVLTYEVKGVDIGMSTARIEEAATIMDILLDGRSYAVEVGGSLYHVTINRTSELQVELPPEDDGTIFQHVGGIYEFFVTRSNA